MISTCRACALTLILLSSVLPDVSDAAAVSARGMGTASYGWRLTAEHRQTARNEARMSAIEAHLASQSPPRMKVFADRRDEFRSRIDSYVLSEAVLNEDNDKDAKTYTVVIRADLNRTLLYGDIDASSAVAMTDPADRSLMALLFVARSQTSAQAFDDRTLTRTDSSEKSQREAAYEERTREGESISADSISTSGNRATRERSNSQVTTTEETGGSVTRRAEVIQWAVSNTSEINSTMSGVLSGGGFEIVEAEFIEPYSGGHLDIEKIRADYSTGDDLSAAVLQSTVQGMRTAEIPFLAMGTLDVGVRDTDPVTGNPRIFVTVNGKVLDLNGRFPRTVASVGPVQFSGTGPTETVARSNALMQAADRAAQVLVENLNQRGVR